MKIGNLAKQAAGNDFFGQLHELSVSSDFAGNLLAARKDFVITEIGRYSGASIASASFITGIAGFASLDCIGRQMAAGPALDAKGFALWLDTQRESIKEAIPPGLEVKPTLGIHRRPRERAIRIRRTRVLSAVLGFIVLSVAIYYEFGPHGHTHLKSSVNSADTSATAPVR